MWRRCGLAPAPARARAIWGPLAVAVVAAGVLAARPLVLGDADESFVLYGARRVYEGQALYHDFFELLAPGAFYLFALVFAVGGQSLAAVRVATGVVDVTSTVLVFVVARRLAAPLEAAVVALVFIAVGVPVWPYASAHWPVTAAGLGVAALLVSERAAALVPRRALAAGVLAGAACMMHQQRGAVLAVGTVAALTVWALFAEPRDWRRWWRAVAAAIVGIVAVAGVVIGHALTRASVREFWDATVSQGLGGYRAWHGRQAVAWGGWGILSSGFLAYTWPWLLRALPWALAAEALCLAWGRRARHAVMWRMRLVTLVLAITAAAGIVYCPDYIHVTIVMPFLLLVAARLLHGVRSRAWWNRSSFLRPVPAVVLVAVLLAAAVKTVTNVQLAWKNAPLAFETRMGTLRGSRARLDMFAQIRAVVNPDGRDGVKLFAYPADAWLYLALPAEAATRFSLLLVGYNAPGAVAEVVSDLERGTPEFVFVLTTLVTPDDPIVRLIQTRYEPVGPIAPGGFLYRRRS